jgi:hypothetical protein
MSVDDDPILSAFDVFLGIAFIGCVMGLLYLIFGG